MHETGIVVVVVVVAGFVGVKVSVSLGGPKDLVRLMWTSCMFC